jgi:meiotically up-regulated gene 157 (Mug157) protein
MLTSQEGMLMHESFAVGSPKAFTRQWFAWANSMFAGAVLALAGGPFSDLVRA